RAGQRLVGLQPGHARRRGRPVRSRRGHQRAGGRSWARGWARGRGGAVSGKNPRDVIIRPVVSEKSYASFDENVYTFVVAPDANKTEIRQAVESIFGVGVTNVNTLNRSGKRKRNRRTGAYGTRPSTKRAVVSLAEGDRIEIFGS